MLYKPTMAFVILKSKLQNKEHSEKPCLLHLDNSVQNELKDKNAHHLPFPFAFFYYKPGGVMDDITRQFGLNVFHAGLCRLPN